MWFTFLEFSAHWLRNRLKENPLLILSKPFQKIYLSEKYNKDCITTRISKKFSDQNNKSSREVGLT